jgi:hypothetical protein
VLTEEVGCGNDLHVLGPSAELASGSSLLDPAAGRSPQSGHSIYLHVSNLYVAIGRL